MRHFTHLILIFFVLTSLVCCGQNKNNKGSGKGNYIIIEDYSSQSGFQYLTPDTSFYLPLIKIGYTIYLPKGDIRGALVYPGIVPDSTKQNDALEVINIAIKNNLAIILLSTGRSIDFLFTNEEIKSLDSVLHNALVKGNLKDKPIIFVGMSLGGTVIMRHAEYCLKGKSEFGIKPNALVLIDAPLDFVKWWYSCEKDKRNNYNKTAYFEANWTNYYLEENLNGTPENAMQNYIEYSPYVYTDTIKSKLSLYNKMPVLAITEPDIHWWMEERGKDYYSLNSFDLAAFINDLRIRGNKEARLVITSGKGYRENGMRHPHSWSIVDIEELIKWSIEIVVKQE